MSQSFVHRPRALILAGLALIPLLLAACGSSSTAPGQATTARLALDWTPNTNHTGIYVAQQKGWYRDEGVSLSLTPYSSSISPEQLVATGQADFGISFTEGVTSARAAGLSIVSIAAVIQSNTGALVTLKSSGLDNVGKLAGKRYAGFGAPYEQPLISQVIGCGGAQDTSFRDVTTDQDPIVALKSGQFDFAWIYMGWEGIEAQRQSVDLNTFMVKDNCVPDYYSPVIITSEKTIKEKPDLVRHFLAATAKGYDLRREQPRRRGETADRWRAKGHIRRRGAGHRQPAVPQPALRRGCEVLGAADAGEVDELPQVHVRAPGDSRRQWQSHHQRAELRRRLHQRLPAEVLTLPTAEVGGFSVLRGSLRHRSPKALPKPLYILRRVVVPMQARATLRARMPADG